MKNSNADETSSGFDQGRLFNPEGLWEHAGPITSEDIAEARNGTWRKFDPGESYEE